MTLSRLWLFFSRTAASSRSSLVILCIILRSMAFLNRSGKGSTPGDKAYCRVSARQTRLSLYYIHPTHSAGWLTNRAPCCFVVPLLGLHYNSLAFTKTRCLWRRNQRGHPKQQEGRKDHEPHARGCGARLRWLLRRVEQRRQREFTGVSHDFSGVDTRNLSPYKAFGDCDEVHLSWTARSLRILFLPILGEFQKKLQKDVSAVHGYGLLNNSLGRSIAGRPSPHTYSRRLTLKKTLATAHAKAFSAKERGVRHRWTLFGELEQREEFDESNCISLCIAALFPCWQTHKAEWCDILLAVLQRLLFLRVGPTCEIGFIFSGSTFIPTLHRKTISKKNVRRCWSSTAMLFSFTEK